MPLLFIISINVMAVTPPTIEVVNQYVSFAHKVDIEVLKKNPGPWTCKYDLIHDQETIYGSAKNMKDATTAMQLVCIKHQCDTLGETIDEAQKNLKKLSESDLRDFLEFQGLSQADIDKKVVQIKNNPVNPSSANCLNGTDSMRMLAFDTCFAVPVVCSKR